MRECQNQAPNCRCGVRSARLANHRFQAGLHGPTRCDLRKLSAFDDNDVSSFHISSSLVSWFSRRRQMFPGVHPNTPSRIPTHARADGKQESESRMSYIDAPPKASILIESMRDIGYSLDTALADVMDNSITARATRIDIRVAINGPPTIAILDDGAGLTKDELLESMRLGSRHPQEMRESTDLGRFGLGLKTASFSQCRRLTVVSRREGVTCGATWDLDAIARDDKWSLRLIDDASEVPFVGHLGPQGTMVLWENLDRAVELGGSDAGRRDFVRRVDQTRKHLELVFHRYLSGERGTPRIAIAINELPLKPFDPYNSSHPATMRGSTERVQVGDQCVEITPYTLPHHRNVSQAEWERYAGDAGYLKNQGFYLYRAKRLIVHGTWFGLARQMELTKLCRVQIDMPNRLDTEWQVDVKKASARPPIQVRERLQRILAQLGAPSRRIYTQRGQRLYDATLPVWQRVHENNEIVYRLNPDNPVISAYRSELPRDRQVAFDNFIQVVSGGLPMDAIFADLAGSPESVRAAAPEDKVLEEAVELTYEKLLAANVTPETIPSMLRVSEPFRSNWDRVEALLERLAKDDD